MYLAEACVEVSSFKPSRKQFRQNFPVMENVKICILELLKCKKCTLMSWIKFAITQNIIKKKRATFPGHKTLLSTKPVSRIYFIQF